MATGNMFLGGARGSVGDITLAVQNGQQTYRQRNRQPRNPRSKRQMFQRASFSVPVKFFTRGTQQLFKFAFTDKKQTESDYNAFMRANAKRGILMTKEQLTDPYIANLGNFQLTKGDLPGIRVTAIEFAETEITHCVKIITDIDVESAPTTFGELSTAILATYPALMRGDIITALYIATDNGYDSNIPYLSSDHVFEPRWVIEQMILDPDEATTLTQAWTCAKESSGKLSIANPAAELPEEVGGGAIIVSRNTANGLRVSSSSIHASAYAKEAMALMTPDWNNVDLNDPWVAHVLASWGASEEAILQGSLVPKATTHSFVIKMVNPVEIDVQEEASRSSELNLCTITFEKFGYVKLSDIKLVGDLSAINAKADISFAAGEGDTGWAYVKLIPLAGSVLAEGDTSVKITVQDVVVSEGTIHLA